MISSYLFFVIRLPLARNTSLASAAAVFIDIDLTEGVRRNKKKKEKINCYEICVHRHISMVRILPLIVAHWAPDH